MPKSVVCRKKGFSEQSCMEGEGGKDAREVDFGSKHPTQGTQPKAAADAADTQMRRWDFCSVRHGNLVYQF